MPGLKITNIKKGLVIFWALWFTLALITNLADALKMLGGFSETFSFVSENYSLLRQVTNLSSGMAGVLFAGVILWEGLATWLFWKAAVWGGINMAFGVSLGLWAAMILADELFLVYKTMNLEGEHLRIFVAQLISFMAIHLLPNLDAEKPE